MVPSSGLPAVAKAAPVKAPPIIKAKAEAKPEPKITQATPTAEEAMEDEGWGEEGGEEEEGEADPTVDPDSGVVTDDILKLIQSSV
jgi:hypothetical protein